MNTCSRCQEVVCHPSKVLCKKHLQELSDDIERILGGAPDTKEAAEQNTTHDTSTHSPVGNG